MAERYIEESDWTDMMTLRICLCGIGMEIGSALFAKARKGSYDFVIFDVCPELCSFNG